MKPIDDTRLRHRPGIARRFPWFLTSALVLSLFPNAIPQSGAQQAPASKTKTWPVREPKGALEISPSTITLKEGKQLALGHVNASQEIPVSKVTEISYDYSLHSRSQGWLNAANGIASTPLVLGVYPLVIPLLGAAFVAPFKTRAHVIRIAWIDGKHGPAEMLLEIGKDDYAGVLAELQSVTGKPFLNRPAEREKRLQEIQSGKVPKPSFTLQQVTLVNDAELKPGPYLAVVLKRPQDMGEVYFYHGDDLNPDHFVAQTVATIEKQSSPKAGATPIFSTAYDSQSMAALEMPNETLRFAPLSVPSNVESSARSFYAGKGRWATVKRTTYQAETAFLFSLDSASCSTDVYVTRDHFAIFCKHKDLYVARGEVKVTPGKSGRDVQVTVKDKSWTFHPFIGSGMKTSETGQSGIAAREVVKFFVRTVTDFDAVERETAPNSQKDPKQATPP